MNNQKKEDQSMTRVISSWTIIRDDQNFVLDVTLDRERRNSLESKKIAMWLRAMEKQSREKESYAKYDHFLYQYGRETDFSSKIILPSKGAE